MVDFYNLYVNTLLNEEKEQQLRQRYSERERQRLLYDPENIDELAAAITAQLSPTTKKARKGKFTTKAEAIDDPIPDDHPMKGFAVELRDKLYQVFSDRRTLGGDISSIAHETASFMLAQPGRKSTERGRPIPRYMESFEYRRREEGKLSSLVFGADKDIATPVPSGFPTYEQWHHYISGRERQKYESRPWVEHWIASPKEILGAAAIGGGVGLLAGPGAPLVAGAAVLGEIVAKPFRSWITGTERYRSHYSPLMVTNDWWDKAKAVLMSASPDFAFGLVAEAKLLKMLTVPKEIMATGAGPAIDLLKASEAARVGYKKAMQDKTFRQKVAARLVGNEAMKLGFNKAEIPFYKGVLRKRDETRQVFLRELKSEEAAAALELPGIPPITPPGGAVEELVPTKVGFSKVVGSLDEEATEEMLTATRSSIAGAFEAYERQLRRRLFEDSGYMAEVDGKIGRRYKEFLTGANEPAEKVHKILSNVDPEEGVYSVTRGTPEMREVLERLPEKAVEEAPVRRPLVKITRQENQYMKANNLSAKRVTWTLGREGSDRVLAGVRQLDANPVSREVVQDTSDVSVREIEHGMPEPSAERTIKELETATGHKPKRKRRAPPKRLVEEEKEIIKELEAEAPIYVDSISEADALMREYSRMFDAKEITAEETRAVINRLTEGVYASDNILTQDKLEFSDATDSVMSQLAKVMANKTFMAAFGVGAGILSFFLGGEEAEAGVVTAFAGAIRRGGRAVTDIGTAKKAVIGAMRDARYNVDQVIASNKYILKSEEYQRGLMDSPLGGPTKILKNLSGWVKQPVHKGRYKFMGAYQVFAEILNIGTNLMNNPAVFKASYQAAEYNNIRMARDVLRNIFREAGITSRPREVARRFEPLVDDMRRQVEYEWRTDEISRLDRQYDKWKKSKGEPDVVEIDREINRGTRDNHAKRLEELQGSVEDFHRNWAVVAEEAARDIPSVKVALALGDTPDFKKYPFLADLHFSTDEKTLVGRLREQLLEYKTRLDDLGRDTISGPFSPHIFHPKFTARMMQEIAGDAKAPAYLRMYRRSKWSRPLFPDIHTTMARYVSDMERRIQNQTFWDQGWEKVMKATEDIPSVNEAFKAMREGVKPVDWSATNRLSNVYIQFEVMKRLWLNPSAGLKHLFKATADIASVGFAESLEVTPITLTSLGRRIAQADPTVNKRLSALGVKVRSKQNKMVDNYFKSLVPARDARQRMLDIGLHVSEEYFSDIKNVWNKSQNIGGAWINLAELVDRGLSVFSALDIAAKRGLTIEQALYGAYDLVLKNNFLSREFNPAWMRSPGWRAALMFQATPFKILERRVVNALRAGRSIKRMTKAIHEATKTHEGRQLFLRDLRNLRSYIKRQEQTAKTNLFVDAIRTETDFFGTPIVNQFAKDVFIAGAGTIGGAYAGMSLWHHFFHVPFFQSMGEGLFIGKPIAWSPGIQAVTHGYRAHQAREEGDTEFLFTKIMQRWLGPGNAFMKLTPGTYRKWTRLSEDDIPDIYQDSKFQYIFAIPGKDH